MAPPSQYIGMIQYIWLGRPVRRVYRPSSASIWSSVCYKSRKLKHEESLSVAWVQVDYSPNTPSTSSALSRPGTIWSFFSLMDKVGISHFSWPTRPESFEFVQTDQAGRVLCSRPMRPNVLSRFHHGNPFDSLDTLFARDRRGSNTTFSLICACVHLWMTHHYSDMTTILRSLIGGFL
jgi:hypothetical protein